MDLEHPDVTHIRRTGYPRPIGKPVKENNQYINYNTDEEHNQMDLVDKVNKIAICMDDLEEHGVIDMSYNHINEQYEVLFGDTDKFYEECEGEPVQFSEIDGMRGEMVEASYERFGIKYKVILLNESEHKNMKTLIETE